MKLKISRNKIIIIESAIILLFSGIIIYLLILRHKTPPSLFKYNVSNFEDSKFISIEPYEKDENWFLYLWLTKDNRIREVEYKIGEYALTGREYIDNSLFSTIDFPYFNETSYFMPYKNGQIPEKGLKDILVYKEYTLQSGKKIGVALDKDGNATLLNDK